MFGSKLKAFLSKEENEYLRTIFKHCRIQIPNFWLNFTCYTILSYVISNNGPYKLKILLKM